MRDLEALNRSSSVENSLWLFDRELSPIAPSIRPSPSLVPENQFRRGCAPQASLPCRLFCTEIKKTRETAIEEVLDKLDFFQVIGNFLAALFDNIHNPSQTREIVVGVVSQSHALKKISKASWELRRE